MDGDEGAHTRVRLLLQLLAAAAAVPWAPQQLCAAAACCVALCALPGAAMLPEGGRSCSCITLQQAFPVHCPHAALMPWPPHLVAFALQLCSECLRTSCGLLWHTKWARHMLSQ